MKSRAAVLHGTDQEWQIEEIEVDAPKAGEVLVEWKAAGLCHSDEHLVTGDMVPPEEAWPLMGIDELWPDRSAVTRVPASIVEVGPGVTSVAVGDHVSASFIPSCGRCRYCSTGRQNLCDAGAGAFLQGHDHRRHEPPPHRRRRSRARRCSPSSARSRSTRACPRTRSSRSTTTSRSRRWRSSRAASPPAGARRRTGPPSPPGDTVVVVGIGGIGINAVQGAAMAGARHVIAVDPIEFKREKAMEFGATHTFASMEEALPARDADDRRA